MVRHQFLQVGLWCSPPVTCSHSGCEEQEGAQTVAGAVWAMVQRLVGTTSLHCSRDLLGKHNQLFPSLGLIQREKNLRGRLGDPPLGRRAVCPSQSHKCCAAKMTKGRGKKVKYKIADSFTCLCELFFFSWGETGKCGRVSQPAQATTHPPVACCWYRTARRGHQQPRRAHGAARTGLTGGGSGTGRDGTGLLKVRAGPGGPRRCREAEPPRPAPASPPAPRPPPRRSGRAAPQLGAGPG